MGIIVAIDGPAGAGKSSVAKAVARQTGMTFVDTGAIYRALAFSARQNDVDFDDEKGLAQLTENLPIRFQNTENEQKLFLGDDEVTHAIRAPEVSEWASKVSQYPLVRAGLLNLQRRLGEGPDGAVAEGRDIGTVVFPHAEVKIFLTADPQARAKRRVAQLAEKGIQITVEEILNEMKVRDERDSQRATAPLVKADDAVEIDSTQVTMDQVISQIIQLVHNCKNASVEAVHG
tara:strand:- start:1160 stop:1855 length:696 start_codon:yes stop_codon:yes gene_type:complete